MNVKKTCFVLMIVMIFSSISFAGEPSSWSKYSILNLEYEDILPDDFSPTNATGNVKREDLAELLVKFYGVSSKSSYEAYSTRNPYIDSEDDMVGRAFTTGIFEGYDGGNIYPNKMVTIEEFCNYLMRTANALDKSTVSKSLTGYTDYDDVNYKYKEAVDFAFGIGLINNGSSNQIKPNGNITWEIAAYAVEKMGLHYGFIDRGFVDQDKENSKFNNVGGFLYPKENYSQLTIYPIESGYLKLYMYSSPFVRNQLLDMKSQQIELTRVLESNSDISFSVSFQVFKYAIKNWEEVQRLYIEEVKYVNLSNGVITDSPVGNKYLRLQGNGKLIIEYISK
jgi:hypothetical protein